MKSPSIEKKNYSYITIGIFEGERGADGKGGMGGKQAKNGRNCNIKRMLVSYFYL